MLTRAVGLALTLRSVGANDNGLALTPPLGWRSWNCMLQNVSQERILAQVDALVTRRNGKPSLLELGFSHLGIDDGWQACGTGYNHSFHDASGKPLVNLTRFPSMQTMTDTAHAKGVSVGWYGNNCGCNEMQQFGNIGGHVAQDAQATAAFGFDGLKVDGCGPSQNITAWTAQLNATGRPVLLEDCLTKRYSKSVGSSRPIPENEWPLTLAQVFDRCPGNFFRLGGDIAPQFYSTVHNLIFTQNLSAPFNAQGKGSRPGCWTYNDMLEVGNLHTLEESYAHFASFAISSSPLILGFDLTDTQKYDEVYPIISNKRALEINQDWAGHPGEPVLDSGAHFEAPTAGGAGARCLTTHTCKNQSFPTWQVWRKPLSTPEGAWAVLALNIAEKPNKVRFQFADIDPQLGSNPTITDVWSGASVACQPANNIPADSSCELSIGPHAARFLELYPVVTIADAVSH